MIKEFEFIYTGEEQIQKLIPGIYKFEVWGAEGSVNGGKGGYAVGYYNINSDTDTIIYVGGSGEHGGFNGGGTTSNTNIGAGGGASDIRLNNNELSNRIIVAGGGGGGCSNGNTGGAGGGLNGENGSNNGGTGGAQNKGNAKGVGGGGSSTGTSYDYECTDATGAGYDIITTTTHYTGGGGGYYGGNKGVNHVDTQRRHEHYTSGNKYTNSTSAKYQGAGGGSGYVSPLLSDSLMETGVRSGDGLVKITSESYNFFNFEISNKTLKIEPITDISVINSVNIVINNNGNIELIDLSNEPMSIALPDDMTVMGTNNVEIIVNATVYDITDEYSFSKSFIRFGEHIPDDVGLNTFKDYLSALATYTSKIKNELTNMLIDNSIISEEPVNITHSVSILKGICEKLNGKTILLGMKPGNEIVIDTGIGSSSGGASYTAWVLTSRPITGLLPEGGEVNINWNVSFVNGGGTIKLEVIRNEEVISEFNSNSCTYELQNGDIIRGTATATGYYGSVGSGHTIKVSYDYNFGLV